MKISQRFVNSCATAIFLCSLAPLALAAGKPVGEWVVGPIAGKSTTGAQYCSMKNTFSDGYNLVFARDGAGSNSIALDFKKDMLEVGRPYGVTLRAGVTTRDVSALGATRQVLIMQMGKDAGFYTALERKNSLALNLGRDSYSFDLDASVAAALDALNDCSASLKTGGTFAQVTVPTGTQAAAADISEDRVKAVKVEKVEKAEVADAASLMEEIRRLRAENKKLLQEARSLQKLYDSATNDLTRTRAENDRLGRAVETGQISFREETARLESERARLIREADAGHSLQQKTQLLHAENEKLAHAMDVAAALREGMERQMLRLKTEQAAAPAQQQAAAVKLSPPAPVASTAAPITITRLEKQAEPAVMTPPEKVEPAAGAVAAKAKAPVVEGDLLKRLLVASTLLPATAEATDNTYRWSYEDIYGAALFVPWETGQSLSEMAQGYIKQAADLCNGEFGQRLGDVKQAGGRDILEAQFTCMDGQQNPAAAVLFVADGERLGVITQEGTIDQLTDAMFLRDYIVDTASGT